MTELLREGDALLVVPPFASVDQPSIAVHLLQACARERGLRVSVLYANLHFAAAIGPASYAAIIDAPAMAMLGERIFARAAHGLGPFGERAGRELDMQTLLGWPAIRERSAALRDVPLEATGFGAHEPEALGVDFDDLRRIEALACAWADEVAAAIARLPFRVVGSTTTFEQTNASFALLGRVKRARPEVVTILGGANCEGVLAEGVSSIGPCVDHVFSGESEAAFPAFLEELAAGRLPVSRVVEGAPCRDLEALPLPDYREYFEQSERALPGRAARAARAARAVPAERLIPYESSRGCWWGEKHHCTFCGINGDAMGYREKSAERVIGDLRALAAAHGSRCIAMADNIMPRSYLKALLPRLAAEPEPFRIFYEQKANLDLADVIALKRAGVFAIQAGIEALSSSLLRRMDKGLLARQAVTLLRYTRSLGIDVKWNLLWALPGDEPRDYEETLALVPLLVHLQPPEDLLHISIDRFSPYFDRAEAYGITGLRPHPVYEAVFPPHTDLEKVAYRFVATYTSGAYGRLDVIRALSAEVRAWRARWARRESAPSLRILRFGEHYIVRDTRGLPGCEETLVLDRAQAVAALCAGPCAGTAGEAWGEAWTVKRKLGVVVDGWYVPLLTASAALLEEMQTEGRSRRAAERDAGAPRALPVLRR